MPEEFDWNMSDEDMMNVDPDTIPTEAEMTNTPDEQEAEGVAEDAPISTTEADVPTTGEEPTTTPEDDAMAEDAPEEMEGEEPAKADETSATDMQGYTDILNGFDADGTTIKINSPDELKRILQSGIGANRRMQELAPKLKMISMLESNKLLDADKLNFLIDLSNNDTDAIKKLISDSDIDVMELGTGEAQKDYAPKDHSVTDQEFALQQTIDQNKSRPNYQETLQFVSSMDDNSKTMINDKPERLSMLVDDVENGRYTQIRDIVVGEQIKGNMAGQSFLQAYEAVVAVLGEDLASKGGNPEAGHNNTALSTGQGNNAAATPHDLTGTQAQTGKGSSTNAAGTGTQGGQVGTASKAAKQAASASTRTGTNTGTPSTLDTSAMTDADFLKYALSNEADALYS